jgi:CRP-like cAMP-binding protein
MEMDIKEILAQKYKLSDYELEKTTSSFVIKTFKAKELFLEQGMVSNVLGFIKSGLLRSYYFDNNADEITTHFFRANTVVISVDSFLDLTKSKETIVAIEDSELFVITYQKLNELYDTVPVWQLICKDFAEMTNKSLLARVSQFQTLSATERYQFFCNQNPDIVKKVALRHIASYLGIDIATLSRIRKKPVFLT